MAAHFLRFPLIEVCSGFLYLWVIDHSLEKRNAQILLKRWKTKSNTRSFSPCLPAPWIETYGMQPAQHSRTAAQSTFDSLECLRQNKILRWPRETLSRFAASTSRVHRLGVGDSNNFRPFCFSFKLKRMQMWRGRVCVWGREHLVYTCVCPGALFTVRTAGDATWLAQNNKGRRSCLALGNTEQNLTSFFRRRIIYIVPASGFPRTLVTTQRSYVGGKTTPSEHTALNAAHDYCAVASYCMHMWGKRKA